MNLETHYPDCLYNSHKNLDLGSIQLRYLDLQIPSLITIFELERPAILAHNQISKIQSSLQITGNDDYAFKGLFVLGIAQFESMLNDLMVNMLRFYPQKLSLLKHTPIDERATGNGIGQEQILNGEVISQIIENNVNRLAYSSLDNFLKTFAKVFAIEESDLNLSHILDQLIEIKETRNLLLHNNLVTNDFYFKKTRAIKRATEIGQKLTLDKAYTEDSLNLIANFIEAIVVQIRLKYGHFTVLPLLKKLFAFNFSSPIIHFDEFCTLNEEKDIYDGPFKMPEGRSSSEDFFLEFWQAQRAGLPITRPALVHLGGSVRNLAFLTEVFGEFRFPYW